MYESLTQLIIDNVEVGRWLLKIDDEFEGRGIACLDVARNLKCYSWVAKEAERYGDKWKKKWAQVRSSLSMQAMDVLDRSMGIYRSFPGSNPPNEFVPVIKALTFTPPGSFPSSQFWGIYALIGGVRVKMYKNSPKSQWKPIKI